VSSAERLVRHHKQQTDRAISRAFTRLAGHPAERSAFEALLARVRLRAPGLLRAQLVGSLHPGVEALVHLARFRHAHIRDIASWAGSDRSWRAAVSALAQHLLARYRVPVFLSASWYATDAYGDRKRQWFIAHALGTSVRSLDLPIAMTSQMEHHLLRSRHHLPIELAMRRAELLGLGAPDDLLREVLATSAGPDLEHGAFWRTVWRFFIDHERELDRSQIVPIVDYIYTIRQERFAIETPEGVMFRDPPQPAFSMKGRTVRSVLRLMHEWHRSLGLAHGGLRWAPSPLRPMAIEEPPHDPLDPPTVWQFVELTNGDQLREEGVALKHCVGSYATACWRGRSRIWSLRSKRVGMPRSVLTIEVDMKRRTVVQARGRLNRQASGKPLRLLRDWADRERLRLKI